MKKNLLLSVLIMSVLVLTTFGVVSATCEGAPCNDGNPCTVEDVFDAECICAGTPIQGCSFCGDDIVQYPNYFDQYEVCDNGVSNQVPGSMNPVWDLLEGQGDRTYCSSEDCTTFFVPGTWCGDEVLQEENEECDDGNNVAGDGCSPTCEIEYCNLVIDEPFQSILGYMKEGQAFFDSELVPITWHLEGNTCTPIDVFYLFYEKDGNCDPDTANWTFIPGTEGGLAQNDTQISPYEYLYEWNRPAESGQYCVKIKVTSNGARDVSDYFNVDLAHPIVNLTVGTPQAGDCSEGDGDCYVNQDTEIKISCSDSGYPWQSGYWYKQYQYSLDGGAWTDWINDSSFTFHEDSNHLLRYRCFDHVGKMSEEKTKNFFVESDTPMLDRTVNGPQECPEDDPTSCIKYFNLNTEICVDLVENPDHEHDVPGVEIWCHWDWYDDKTQGSEDWFLVDECFSYTEDSWHTLECKVTDALGNSYWHNPWSDVVDAKAPITTLSYTRPYYTEDRVQWIDTVSRVVLTAEDQEPHPVGYVTTFYRYGKVNDEFCYGTNESDWDGRYDTLEQDWTEYYRPFELPQSCHAIEYYSVDKLGNTETTNVEFVFSDHTAPALDLEVGESGKDCSSQDVDCEDGWDWIVTMGTPITISCEDQIPHPSGVQKICYTIDWDGDTQPPTEVCENTNELTIWFREPCEHRLEYTCYDNVEKHSNDSRTFKVIGDNFTIYLDKKWNLISVPVNLLSSSVEEVFGDDENIEEVWSYENGEWFYYIPSDEDSTLTDIIPGRGYWVKTSNPTVLIIGGSLFEEGSVIPNSVPINPGWNLIGHYGMASKPRICALASIFNEWSTLMGYGSTYSNPFYDAFWMNPGEGYWFFAQGNDSYAYANKACFGPY